MNATAASSPMTFARSGRSSGAIHLDSVTIGLVLAITLLGLVMVTSASVSIASKDSGETFYYLERQLILMLSGGVAAAFLFCIRTELLERCSTVLLVTAIVLLLLVFIPGLG
ncbi:MAG TPA: FtsW/RodA/SpoVE family cell cycle protein, partial [Steroidobacteraceae bacterium]|nr:FtsW/RodA/SpoVE family cell cycle protein [Steroidobacteraceae bacterium]